MEGDGGASAAFHLLRTRLCSLGHGIGGWDTAGRPPFNVRMAGLASIVLWATVIAAGRLMAYTF